MRSLPLLALNGNRRRVVALIALLAAGLPVACRSTPGAAPAVSTDTWAVVDGREIARDVVERAFRRLGDGSQTMSEDEALTAKLGLLDDLIVEDILLAKARELKLTIAESEVDKAYE